MQNSFSTYHSSRLLFETLVDLQRTSHHPSCESGLVSRARAQADWFLENPSERKRRAYARDLGLRVGAGLRYNHSVVLRSVLTLHISRAEQTLRAIEASMTIDGPVPPFDWSSSEVLSNVLLLACYDLEGLLLSWLKETSALLACRCFQQDETNLGSCEAIRAKLSLVGLSSPPPGVLLFGSTAKYCRWLMAPRKTLRSPFGQRILRLGEDILYIKRACPPILGRFVLDELDKHKSRVCRPLNYGCPTSWAAEVRELTKKAIRAIVTRTFSGRHDFVPIESFPSLSSAFDSCRKTGGAMGELFDHFQGASNLPVSAFLGSSQLDYMVESAPGRVCEVRQRDSDRHRVEEFSRVISSLTQVKRRIHVKPHPIPEPCKVRVITLGEAVPYQRLLPVQQWLWRTMSSNPTFRYTAEPILDTWAEVFDPTEDVDELSGSSFVSGDFSAATDNLDPELSAFTWRCVAECSWVRDDDGRVPLSLSGWYDLVLNGLVGHDVLYPGDKEATTQTWGQLMGSPVSFPILNMVNAATTAVALYLFRRIEDPDVRFEPLRELAVSHCRTNGDDLFFVCPDGGYDIWQRVVTLAGLCPSLGKNYLSKDFCVMNSELRCLTRASGPVDSLGHLPGAWRYEVFCNLPLVFGMEAKGEYAGRLVLDKLAWWQLGGLSRAVVRGIDPADSRYSRRLVAFETCHREVLARVPGGVEWHIPQQLGGVGLPRYDRTKPLNQLALQRAAWLSCLDLRKQTKAVTPPKVESSSLWDVLLKAAMSKHVVRLERIVERNPDDDYLPARLENANRKIGACLLASALEVYDAMVDPFKVPCGAPARESAARQYLDACGRALTPEMLRSRAELRYAHEVKKQLRACVKSSLEPMSESTADSWTLRFELVETTYAPHIRSLITLPL